MKTQNEQQYLKKLLNKHQKTKELSESFVMAAGKNYEKEIKSGRYAIKEGQKFQKKNKHLSKAEIQNMKDLKRNLQQNLNLIDSRVGELTEPQQKKLKMIDDNQRRKFVSQMSKVRRSLQKHREKQYKEREQKFRQMYEKQIQEVKKKQEQDKKKRQQQIMKRAQSIQIQKKQKQVQLQEQNKVFKMKMNEKILSERMLERYRDRQAKDLEQQKKRLAELRTLHKPMNKTEFQEHLQKIDKLKTSRQLQHSAAKIVSSNSTKFYKSNWYKKAKEAPKQFFDEKHEHELEHIKQMKDKLKKYAEYVKHNFKPDIDRRKAKSMAEKNKSVPIPPTEDLRQLGLKYLQYSKTQIDANKRQRDNDEDEMTRKVRHINYLQELKKSHEAKAHLSAKQYIENIKQKSNLSESEKAQKILDHVESIERKAKLREQKGKINKAFVDEELDNLYMEAIAMKLSMLGKQH